MGVDAVAVAPHVLSLRPGYKCRYSGLRWCGVGRPHAGNGARLSQPAQSPIRPGPHGVLAVGGIRSDPFRIRVDRLLCQRQDPVAAAVVPVSEKPLRRGETGTATAGDGGAARVAGDYAPGLGSASGNLALIRKRPPRNRDRGTTLRLARVGP